jgi:hypothetical protein
MVEIKSSIKRISMDIKDGRSFYYFSLADSPGLIFVATSNLSSFLPLSKPGDLVEIWYLATQESEVNINKFHNITLEG